MAKIMLVEDDVVSREVVTKVLAREHELLLLEDADDIVEQARKFGPDIILMDISLPRGNGLQACAQLQNDPQTAQVPLFFFTAQSGLENRLLGLSLGADDYLEKPVNPTELKLRVNNRLKRDRLGKGQASKQNFGPLHVDFSRQTAVIVEDNKEHAIPLTAREFRLLSFFVKHEGHVLSREQILNEVWGQGVHVTDRSVDAHVSALRRKFKPFTSMFESVYGSGYRFDSARAQGSPSKKAA